MRLSRVLDACTELQTDIRHNVILRLPSKSAEPRGYTSFTDIAKTAVFLSEQHIFDPYDLFL